MSHAILTQFAGNNCNPDEVIYHNTTHYAYENLLNGDADIIFVTEPSAEAQKIFDDAGVEIVTIPIVKDAFVLLVNDKNPVKSLTQQQLRDIYSGKITNWKQVGGADMEILPFQRESTSGSQTLFLSLLMRDTQPMIAPTSFYYADMGGIIDAVAEFNNGESSIGYSVFYYAYAMYGNDNVRFLEVDGVLPTEESIIAGTYPLISYYYAVIRKDTPLNHPVRELINWILSGDGQTLMRKTGYVPLRELSEPYNKDGVKPQYYGEWDYYQVYGIGAELREPSSQVIGSIYVYGISKKLDSGVSYSHPYTSSKDVNALLDTFIEDALAQEDFKERMAKSINEYDVPFRQLTLQHGRFLTCVIYFGSYTSKHLYTDIWGEFDAYASICIDIPEGKIVGPEVIIEDLMKIKYMDGVKSIYEGAARVVEASNPDHMPSDEHVITALWVHSEQGLIIEIMDQGNSYRYGISLNDYGGFAGE